MPLYDENTNLLIESDLVRILITILLDNKKETIQETKNLIRKKNKKLNSINIKK